MRTCAGHVGIKFRGMITKKLVLPQNSKEEATQSQPWHHWHKVPMCGKDSMTAAPSTPSFLAALGLAFLSPPDDFRLFTMPGIKSANFYIQSAESEDERSSGVKANAKYMKQSSNP